MEYLPIIITGISGFLLFLSNILTPIILNGISERRDRIKEKQYSEISSREKRKDFHTAYLELMKSRTYIQRIIFLMDQVKDFDITNMKRQINSIKINDIINLNKNTSLDEKELNVAKKLFYVDTIQDSIRMYIDLLDAEKISEIDFNRLIRNIDNYLEQLENEIIIFLGDCNLPRLQDVKKPM